MADSITESAISLSGWFSYLYIHGGKQLDKEVKS